MTHFSECKSVVKWRMTIFLTHLLLSSNICYYCLSNTPSIQLLSIWQALLPLWKILGLHTVNTLSNRRWKNKLPALLIFTALGNHSGTHWIHGLTHSEPSFRPRCHNYDVIKHDTLKLVCSLKKDFHPKKLNQQFLTFVLGYYDKMFTKFQSSRMLNHVDGHKVTDISQVCSVWTNMQVFWEVTPC